MKPELWYWVLGGLVVGVGAVALVLRKPKPAPRSNVGFDASKPHVGVTVATGYNKVDFTPVVLDLNHLTGSDWQTHNTVVI
jgi:hypothetical protein